MPKPKTEGTPVQRFDYVDFWSFGNGAEKFKETPEGFLQGRAVLTNVGVFPYLRADGTVSMELRPPEEVFKQESMDSAKGKPFTDEHPTELVTPENWEKYSAGSVGENITRDDMHLLGFITIQKKQAILDVKAGKRALSQGYTSNTVDHDMSYPINDWQGNQIDTKVYKCPGVWMGISYDKIQTNIVYNHTALVTKGRAGDDAVLRMDGAGILALDHIPQPKPNQTGPRADRSSKMKQFNIDNVSFEVEDSAIPALQTLVKDKASLTKDLDESLGKLDELTTELDDKKKDLEKVRAEYDKMKAECDAKKAELASAKEEAKKVEESIPGKVDSAIKTRLTLLDAAALAKINIQPDAEKPAMTNDEISKAVIAVVYPGTKLDGQSETYVQVTFDLAMQKLTKDAAGIGRRGAVDVPNSSSTPGVRVDSSLPQEVGQAKSKYDAAMADAWKH